MIAAKVEIKGLDDVLRTLDAAPKEMKAVARKAMTAASKATTKEMNAKTPPRWRQLVGWRVNVNRRTGNINARMGYYNTGKKKGKKAYSKDLAFDWFKAYWANYGTLDYRDPKHVFRYPVKPRHYAAAKRRLKGVRGQHAQHFFENAKNGWENTFLSAFRSAFDANYEKALGK
jgi:hypothetical protein